MRFTTAISTLFFALSSSDGKLLRGGEIGTDNPTTSMYPSNAPTTSMEPTIQGNFVPQLMSYEMANELLDSIPIADSDSHNKRRLDSNDEVKFCSEGNNYILDSFSIADGNLDTSPFKDIFPCKGEFDKAACIEIVAPTTPSIDFSRTISDELSRKQYIKSSVQAEGGAFGGYVSTTDSYMTSSTMTTNSVSFMKSGTINTHKKRVRNPDKLELHPDAKTLLSKNLTGFIQNYGSNFVSSIGYGGSFAGGFNLLAESSEQQNELGVQVDAGYANDIFSANGSANFEEERSSSSFELNVGSFYYSLPEMAISRFSINTPMDLAYVYGNWSKAARKTPAPTYLSVDTYSVSNDVRNSVSQHDLQLLKGFELSSQTVETATLEQLQTKLLIKSIQNLLDWPGMKNKESTQTYKDLMTLKANATAYHELYTSKFTDVSLYELQAQLLTGEKPLNQFGTWLLYSQSGGLSEQFNALNPKLEITYVSKFDGLSGFQCCRDNRLGISGSWSKHAKTPYDCQEACTNDDSCNYFDHGHFHSNSYGCAYCTECQPITGSDTKYYTSYAKKKQLVSSVETILLNPPAQPAYNLKYAGSQCCRSDHQSNRIDSSTPFGCEEHCTDDSTCNYFDHSDKYGICLLCNQCKHTTSGKSKHYNSWKKVSTSTSNDINSDPEDPKILFEEQPKKNTKSTKATKNSKNA